MKQIYILFISVIFTLNYSYAQTNLITDDFLDINSWNITSGQLIISSNTVSTEGNSNMTLAFIAFSNAIGSGDLLKLTFNSNNVTNFATNGWAGVSLYSGGATGTEQIFIGSLGGESNWGVSGTAFSSSISLTESNESVSVTFTYEYNTGKWTINVGGETKNGTISSNLALNTLRIAADINNNADIAISDLLCQENSTSLSTTDYNFKDKANIYPNPSNGFIQIDGLTKAANYIVYNSLGREVLNGSVSSSNEKIDIQNLNNGVYLFKFENGNTLKFIKK